MNIVEIEQFGEVEAIRLGYGPIGRPFMSVYLYILDGLVIDTGQRHMQKAVIQLLDKKNCTRSCSPIIMKITAETRQRSTGIIISKLSAIP